MNQGEICLCCKKSPMYMKNYYLEQCPNWLGLGEIFHAYKGGSMNYDRVFQKVICEHYEPRPEPDLSHCKAVLKMLGAEVGE